LLVVKSGSLLFDVPVPSVEQWRDCEPSALAFRDVDGDGTRDILVMAQCDTGIGPSVADPFQVGDVLFHRDHALKIDPRVTKALDALGLKGRAPQTLKSLEAVARKALAQ
jgi:hypothetical protein